MLFRSLLQRAEQMLAAQGTRAPEIEALLAPAQRLLVDNAFWTGQLQGLAVYLAPGQLSWYRLPMAIEEQVIIGDRFIIRPLLPLLTLNTHFLILALSQSSWRLFDCTRHSWEEVQTTTDLESLAPEPDLPETRKPLTLGSEDATARADSLRYLRQVSRDVTSVLPSANLPIILAGVDTTVADFREVSDLPRIHDQAVLGNPDTTHPRDLHAAAWALLEPKLKATREAAGERYQQLRGQRDQRASNDVAQVVAAAGAGRVETLFVSRRAEVLGHFDAETGEATLTLDDTGTDLLDLAAAQTLVHGGHVYASDEALPDEGPLAALYRY
ncbi:MAG TPA: hypothetical protein DCZ72_15210 [Armatimonadetes bacterium]|nr:hypothetical protein [Armatimonadota bacterium]